MEVNSQPRPQLGIQIKSPAGIRVTAPIRFAFYFLISVTIPLLILLRYTEYAKANGIILENGCEGPGVPFGIISGILFAAQLRWIELSPDQT